MRSPEPLSPEQLAEQPIARPDVPPSGRWTLLLRLAIALGLLAGVVHLAHTPVHRPLDDLLGALRAGDVTTVTIERPRHAPDTDVMGTFDVHWDGGVRPAYSSYEYSTMGRDGGGQGLVDESEMVVRAAEQSPTDVDVTVRSPNPPTSGVSVEPGGLAFVAALFVLIAGRQPRLATKWAWFWLVVLVPPASLAFVLLEPTPLWRSGPQPARASRLTGGWGFLLALVLTWVLVLIPGYTEFFPQ